MIPLILRLKKSRHKETARAQDLVVEELYNIFNIAVLHGGNAIWRCYQGNRFSEDIDVYLPRDSKKINLLFTNLKKRGFVVMKKQVGVNSLFSNLQFNNANVRLEAIFKRIGGSLKEYETVEGNLITVYTLIPEDLIKEKVDTFLKRLKIRDLYDIFFLLRYVSDKNKIKKELKRLLQNFKQPIDKAELRVLIIDGLIPDVEKMLQYVRRFV